MRAEDVLKTQFGLFYMTTKHRRLRRAAEPEQELRELHSRPVVAVQNNAMGLVSQAPVMESDDPERTKNDPITSASDATDWEAMCSILAMYQNYHGASLGCRGGSYIHQQGGEA